MRSFLIPLSILCVLCPEPASAQVCVPLVGTGQAGFPIAPPCGGLVAPVVLYAAGNPGFTISALAPFPGLAGAPMLLIVGFSAPPLPVPPPLLFPPMGPGFLAVGLPIPILAFAGPAGPVPLPVPLPLPPTGGPLGMIITAHTVVLVGGTIALSEGTGVII